MGRRIGKYELGKTIGKGSFSKVKSCIDTGTGELYAVKIVDKNRMGEKEMENQVKREVNITKLMSHENVVGLKDVLQTPRCIYLIMEFAGGELFNEIKDAGRFTEDQARFYFHQLIMGVLYCHNQGIAHRDLKPENLLLNEKGVLKISDFGFANIQSWGREGGDNLLQTICGTPNYVAPEVLAKRGYNGVPADIWSCGIILYVMVTGTLPFDDDDDPGALFDTIQNGNYRVPDHVTPEANNLLERLLTKDPMKRITLDNVVEHKWFRKDFDMSLLNEARKSIIVPEDGMAEDPFHSFDEMGYDDDSVSQSSPTYSQVSSSSPARLNSFDVESRFRHNEKTLMGTLLLDAHITDTLQTITRACLELNGNPQVKDLSSEVKGFINTEAGIVCYWSVLLFYVFLNFV